MRALRSPNQTTEAGMRRADMDNCAWNKMSLPEGYAMKTPQVSRLLVGLLLSVAATLPLHAEEISDIPADKCTAATVVMAQHMAALNRTIVAGHAAVQLWGKIQALAEKHPEAGSRPIGAVLSKAEAEEFSRTSERIASSNVYRLAESRVERDSSVMLEMLDAARKLKEGAPVPQQSAPEWKYYAFLAALRDTFNGEEMKAPADRARCSLALAFYTDTANAATSLTSSPQVREFGALTTRYGITKSTPADERKMTAADAVRFQELRSWLAEVIPRNENYLTDLYAIWQFSQMANLQYEMQKAELLTYGGAAGQGQIEKSRTTRYNTLTKQMQTTWNIWRYVDKEVPAQFVKEVRDLQNVQSGTR
jgi:hypothetical protein